MCFDSYMQPLHPLRVCFSPIFSHFLFPLQKWMIQVSPNNSTSEWIKKTKKNTNFRYCVSSTSKKKRHNALLYVIFIVNYRSISPPPLASLSTRKSHVTVIFPLLSLLPLSFDDKINWGFIPYLCRPLRETRRQLRRTASRRILRNKCLTSNVLF